MKDEVRVGSRDARKLRSKREQNICRRTKHIEELLKSNRESRFYLEVMSFVQDYPNDLLGKFYYAKLLRRNNRPEEALQLLDMISPNRHYMIEIDKIKCYLALEQYEEVIARCSRCLTLHHADMIINRDIVVFLRRARVYAYGKLGMVPDSFELDEDSIGRQFYDYKEEIAIRYSTEKIGGFYENIDMPDLFQKVRAALPFSTSIFNETMQSDIYLFRLSNIGEIDGKIAHYLKVVTIHNTSDILMISPMIDVKGYQAELISDALWINNDMKKTISQTEKFYRKYKKFL